MPTRPSRVIIPILSLLVPLGLPCGLVPVLAQTAQAGTATSGPGRLVSAQDRERAEAAQPAPGWAFNAEAPAEAEQQRAAALLPGKNPRQLVSDYLKTMPTPQGGPASSRGAFNYVSAPYVANVFPELLIYVLRFPKWPLSANLPSGLESSNVLAVDNFGTVLLVNNPDRLSDFFSGYVHDIKSGAAAQDVMRAWLFLSEELVQDGMFHFSEPVVSASTEKGLSATGTADVQPESGNQGQLSATMQFAENGGISSLKPSNSVRAGIRPICQSTKLLDSDPIVRKMAEQDLLFMGKNCKSYLDEQRAKAQPEQQAAIDRIWRRILEENRN
ncbi:MAG TPA: hypothetical protein V6D22_24275 [Candidatus Obscuribacterales bacterium]